MFRQRHQLIPSRDIDNQRILESDWPKGTPGHTQQKVGHTQQRVVLLNDNFS